MNNSINFKDKNNISSIVFRNFKFNDMALIDFELCIFFEITTIYHKLTADRADFIFLKKSLKNLHDKNLSFLFRPLENVIEMNFVSKDNKEVKIDCKFGHVYGVQQVNFEYYITEQTIMNIIEEIENNIIENI